MAQGSTGDCTWRYRLWQHLTAEGVAFDLVGPDDGLYDPRTERLDSQAYAVSGFDRDHAARWGMSASFPDHPIGHLVRDYRPDVIVEGLGLNDVVALGIEPDQVHQQLAQLVGDARAVDPTVDVVLGALPQTWAPRVREFDAGLPGLAAGLDQPGSRVVASAVPGSCPRVRDTSDDAHPSATGEVKIAAAVADALARLGVGPTYPRPLPRVVNGPTRSAVVRLDALSRRSLTLRWSDPPGATGEYVSVRDLTSRAGWTGRATTTSAQSARRLGGLRPGHRHAVRLQAFKGAGGLSAVLPRRAGAVAPGQV